MDVLEHYANGCGGCGYGCGGFLEYPQCGIPDAIGLSYYVGVAVQGRTRFKSGAEWGPWSEWSATYFGYGATASRELIGSSLERQIDIRWAPAATTPTCQGVVWLMRGVLNHATVPVPAPTMAWSDLGAFSWDGTGCSTTPYIFGSWTEESCSAEQRYITIATKKISCLTAYVPSDPTEANPYFNIAPPADFELLQKRPCPDYQGNFFPFPEAVASCFDPEASNYNPDETCLCPDDSTCIYDWP